MKLTQAMRDFVIAVMLDHRFRADELAAQKRFPVLAERIYRDVLGDSIEKMASLPEGWLPELYSIHVSFGSAYDCIRLLESRRVPHSRTKGAFAAYDARHHFTDEWQGIRDDRKSLYAERDRVRSQLAAVLASVSTINKLVEVWPEAAPFVPTGKASSNLPAVDFKSLNKALKLPVKNGTRSVAEMPEA